MAIFSMVIDGYRRQPSIVPSWRITTSGRWDNPKETRWLYRCGDRKGVICLSGNEGGWGTDTLTVSQHISVPIDARYLQVTASSTAFGTYNLYQYNSMLKIYFDNTFLRSHGASRSQYYTITTNISRYQGKSVLLKLVSPGRKATHYNVWIDSVKFIR